MNKIIEKFQDTILDNTDNNINYYFNKKDNFFILHIHNPYNDTFKINEKNSDFCEKLAMMLFDRNKKNKKGCFNYEHKDNSDNIYDLNTEELINQFFAIDYILILIDTKFNPLSYLSISNNFIYSVCTNILFRNKGYMTILFDSTLKMIEKQVLKIDVDINYLKLNVRKDNPIKDKLIKYYEDFNFEIVDENYMYFEMKLNNDIK